MRPAPPPPPAGSCTGPAAAAASGAAGQGLTARPRLSLRWTPPGSRKRPELPGGKRKWQQGGSGMAAAAKWRAGIDLTEMGELVGHRVECALGEDLEGRRLAVQPHRTGHLLPRQALLQCVQLRGPRHQKWGMRQRAATESCCPEMAAVPKWLLSRNGCCPEMAAVSART